jgi:MoxR-like ATPase
VGEGLVERKGEAEHDEYRRCTAGFLPTASVAFLDEIFKANSAILNTLLTITSECKFDNWGGQEPCPIRCAVGASNELPESDELVALFNRFFLSKVPARK